MKKKAIILVLVLCGSCLLLAKGSNNGPLPHQKTDVLRRLPIMHTTKNRVVLPIRKAGNLILIQGRADTLQGSFILDTGAPYLVLNQTYFRNYRDNPEEQSVNINGEKEDLKIVEVDSLYFQDVSYNKVIADVTDLSQIENRKGVRILGLLGINLFLDFEMEIDLSNNVLYLNRLTEEGQCENQKAIVYHRSPAFTTPLSLSREMVTFKGTVNDEELRFCFDTGAEYNVLDARVPKNVLEDVTIVRKMQLYGSSGGANEVLAGVTHFVNIEGYPLANMQTIISKLEALRAAYGTHIDGIIGYQLLARGTVCVNFKKKELRFYTPFTEK